MSIEFVIPGEAVGKGRPRAFRMGNGVRMHTPERTARYENLVSLSASAAMAGRAPFAGPVEMDLVIVTVPPASWSKKKRAAALAGEVRPTSKPDCSNVLKGIEDAMNGIVFGDDKQVTDVRVRKRYGERAQAMVRVSEAV